MISAIGYIKVFNYTKLRLYEPVGSRIKKLYLTTEIRTWSSTTAFASCFAMIKISPRIKLQKLRNLKI